MSHRVKNKEIAVIFDQSIFIRNQYYCSLDDFLARQERWVNLTLPHGLEGLGTKVSFLTKNFVEVLECFPMYVQVKLLKTTLATSQFFQSLNDRF